MSLAELRAAVKAGQNQTARWLFVQLLDDPSLSRAELAEAYWQAGVAEYRAGHIQTAVTWTKVAAKLARECGQWRLLSRVSLNLIEFYRLMGEVSLAIDLGLRWLEEFGDHPDVSHRKGRFYYNLGVAYRQREEVDKALAHYEKAIEYFEGEILATVDPGEKALNRVFAFMAVNNSAWVLYEMGLTTVADEAYRRAEQLVPLDVPLHVREQRLLGVLRAHAHADSQAVLAQVHEIFAAATEVPSFQLFWLYYFATHALLRTARTDLARAYATMASQEASDANDSHLKRLAYALEQMILATQR